MIHCRHANVFANLFSLMLDANIPDIASERDKTVKKVIQKTSFELQNKLSFWFFSYLINFDLILMMKKQLFI